MKSVARFSLVRRITILVLSVSLVSLLLHFFLVVFLVKPMADNMVAQLNAQITLARLALASAPPNQRDSIVISLQKLGVKASRTKPLDGDKPVSGLRSPPLFPPLMGSPAQPLRPPRDHPTSELPPPLLQGFIPTTRFLNPGYLRYTLKQILVLSSGGSLLVKIPRWPRVHH
jgi:hypothetical protein